MLIAPLPRGGTSGLPPLLCVDFVWFVFVQTCVCYDNQYEFTCTTTLFCPENIVSLKPFVTSGSDHLSVISFSRIPEYWGERCDTDMPFRAEPFLVAYSLHVGQLVDYVLKCHLLQEAVLWWGLKYIVTYVCSNKSLGLIVMPRLFFRLIIVVSSPGPMTCLATNS